MDDHKVRILMVDDEAINIRILEDSLIDHRFDLYTAHQGEEALKIALAISPDIILLDVMMPGLDGFEFCRRLRKNDQLRFTKVLMVSARAMLNERLKGYEVGANDYITKPFEAEELLAKVKCMLDLKYREESEQYQSRLLRAISHEIRTPLSNILGFSSLLENKIELNEEQSCFLKNIIKSSNHLLSFSEKCLMLYELKKGIVLSKEHIHVRALIERVIKAQNEDHQQLTCETDTDKSIFVDTYWVSYALTVVISNALKFSQQQGNINIAVVNTSTGVEVHVQDHGQGIDAGKALNLFDDFCDDTIDDNGHATPVVNLSIARLVMRQHGGNLILKHIPQGGCEFVFYFPACQQPI